MSESYGLAARRARRPKSKDPKGLQQLESRVQLEVGAQFWTICYCVALYCVSCYLLSSYFGNFIFCSMPVVSSHGRQRQLGEPSMPEWGRRVRGVGLSHCLLLLTGALHQHQRQQQLRDQHQIHCDHHQGHLASPRQEQCIVNIVIHSCTHNARWWLIPSDVDQTNYWHNHHCRPALGICC